MPAADPVARKLIAQQAALSRWSKTDTKAGTDPMRRGRLASFARQVDPEGVMPPAELAVRVERAQKAHMVRMSALARQKRAAA